MTTTDEQHSQIELQLDSNKTAENKDTELSYKSESHRDSNVDDNALDCNTCPEYYWIYRKGKILGPHSINSVQELYIANDIQGTVQFKQCKSISTWYKIKLPQFKDLRNNFDDIISKTEVIDFKNMYPNLYTALIIQTTSIQNKMPKLPDAARNSLSCVNKIAYYIGRTLIWIILFIAVILPNSFLFIIFVASQLCKSKISDRTTKIWVRVMLVIDYLILFPLGIYVIFFVLTDSYNEIQSWMIGIISWAICIAISWMAEWYFEHSQQHQVNQNFHYFLFSISGVNANHEKSGVIDVISHIFASLIPAVIIGFISNYILEEKYVLHCSEHIVSSICYQGKCCHVLSSHDIKEAYSFTGALASNILAAYGFIRIVVWICVHGELEAFATALKKRF